MDNIYFSLIILIADVFLLYLVSRKTINEIFNSLMIVTKTKGIVYSLASLIFFPGTAIHELAHFFMATVLFIKVREFKIFPEWYGGRIRLGTVVMEKKDFLRGILVGIAPLFAGFAFFWWLSAFKIFPNSSLLLNAILIYFMFCVSTTMFSSYEDLKELINTVPFLILIGVGLYLFDIRVDLNLISSGRLIKIIKDINTYLFYSLIINVVIVVILKSFRFGVTKK